MDVKKSTAGFVSLEDMFEKYSGRKLDPEKDTILNQVYVNIKQQQQFGGQGMNQFADEYGNEEEQQSENPFEKSLMSYLENISKNEND